ncbi:fibronectin type III domain-containing protein [Actinokineospora sp. NBRC 105648]|uniref:fibronectin type III domain-containing protein n=1 Tax=Actinokineospora sp. NBRC 105648 TaxID=3032206 RepID=UPI0024A017F6|nr:fibronectin type III domain-containing protein [Actinokineospora sp. NBRC 105648]GLZ43729.1 hypothetical protein Acsp05_73530 [Actinokineospora sp. NBRC 105648]
MRMRGKLAAAVCGAVVVSTAVTVVVGGVSQAGQQDRAAEALARGLGVSTEAAATRLRQQDDAHRVLDALPATLRDRAAGRWFDERTGKLALAVTDEATAAQARAAGADPVLVTRGPAELDRALGQVRALVGRGVPGLNTFGVDQRGNQVLVTVNRTRKDASTERFLTAVRAVDGVRVEESDVSPHQQAGEVQPGSPWWPGSESNCSIGFAATDSAGAKQMLTAGHCTNDANQPAYGASGQQNRLGTSNVGGTRSVNAREGDMGVVAVTESGWNLSAAVNTWGGAPVTVTGSAEAIVGDSVCHSGNTSKWKCGTVTYVNETIDYGGGLVIEGLTLSTACSLGGDSGGAWLRGDQAVGLHDGGPSQCVSNPTKDQMSIFQPVREALAKWNLTLYTGGGGDTQAPTVPAGLSATGSTATSVSLSWTASTDNVGVTGYDVYRGSTLATTVTGTTATVTGLTADTAYSFTVRAKDAAGNTSAASAAVSARTQPSTGGDTQAPSTPANPRATAQTDTTVSLTWGASTDNVGVTGYEVYQGNALATTVPGTSATVTGLTPDTAYSFTVRALDAAGNRSQPSAAVSARTTPPAGGRTFTNGTDFPIRDYQTAVSPIRSTATGNAARPVTVVLTATHTCLQDLQVVVVSPSGWRYTLQNSGGATCTAFPGTRTFTLSPFTETAAGTWTLRVSDNGAGDTGVLDAWSITV